MDSNRYKKSSKELPKKRSVNSEDSPSSLRPKIINQSSNKILEPSDKALNKKAIKLSIFARKKSKITKQTEKTTILTNEKDNDIFAVWQKQKEIKKARQALEAQQKVEKAAAKKLNKNQKKILKNSSKNGENQKEISIQLSIPKVSKPKIPKKIPGYKPAYKKYYFAGATFILIPLCLLILGSLMHNNGSAKDKSKQPEVQGQVIAAKPDYTTLKPTTIENQATVLKYDSKTKVASYNDVLSNVPITVSQQPFPETFKKDPTGQVETLAKQMNANDKISTSDATAFSGISVKGPQTIIFTKNDLLVFIFAEKKIDQVTLANYIEKLQ